MVKHTQTIRRLPKNCLSVFDYFVRLAPKGLNIFVNAITGNLGNNSVFVGLTDRKIPESKALTGLPKISKKENSHLRLSISRSLS